MKHRTALVSAMSIAGVMLAGATALGANLGILDSTQGVGEVSAVVDPTTTTMQVGASTTQPTTPAADLVAYQINGVGVVTIARDGGRLELESAEVGEWSYEVETQGRVLAMAFRSGEREVRFEARVTGGQIVVEVWEDQTIVQGGGGGSSAQPSAGTGTSSTTGVTYEDSEDDDSYEDDGDFEDDDSYDDDHEDDEDSYESDDHEDDDHEDDEDDD